MDAVPVLRRHDGHVRNREILVQPVERRARPAPAAYGHRRGRLVGQAVGTGVEQPVQQGAQRPVRPGIVDRRTDHQGVGPGAVDILTQVAQKLSGLPQERVIGSGTVLDSARLKYALGEHLGVDSRSVHAFIVGEHGDSEVVAWSSANVSGVELHKMCEMRGHYKHKENTEEIAANVKNSAYEIINRKHATYYGIAMSVRRICEVIMRDEKSILPVSHMMHGQYGIDGVVLSMPAIVGANGVESDIPIELNGEEALKLKESADALKSILDGLEL